MVKTWNDNEVEAKVHEAMKERDDAERAADHSSAASDDWRQRWSLSLAVANGAALLGVFTAMLDPGKRPWEILGASVLFLLGLICGGILPLIWSVMHGHTADYHWAVARMAGPTDFQMTEDGKTYSSTEYRDAKKAMRRRWRKAGILIEFASGGLFVAGAAYVIVMLTAKLFRFIP